MSTIYYVTRGGERVTDDYATEPEACLWLLRHQSMSVDYATRFEGWAIVGVESKGVMTTDCATRGCADKPQWTVCWERAEWDVLCDYCVNIYRQSTAVLSDAVIVYGTGYVAPMGLPM